MTAPIQERVAFLSEAVTAADRRFQDLIDLGVSESDAVPTIRYCAALRVLRDLISQGWVIRDLDAGLILDAPGQRRGISGDPEPAKQLVRNSMAFAREAQLKEEPTRRFVDSVERKGIKGFLPADPNWRFAWTTEGCAPLTLNSN